MKKRTAFIGAILSLIPLGQPLLIKTGVVLSSSIVMLSLPEKVNADNDDFYYQRGLSKFQNALSGDKTADPWSAIIDFTKAIEINPSHADAYYLRGVLQLLSACSDFEQASTLGQKTAIGEFKRYCSPVGKK